MSLIKDYMVTRDRNVYERATGNWMGTLFVDQLHPIGWNALCSYANLYSKCGSYLCQPDRTPRRKDALVDLIEHHDLEHSK